MRVRQLKLTAFRNYRKLDFHPGEGLNILHGENAQGKSNVLEALSLLATTRSLRAGRESELILRGEEVAFVTAEAERERDGETELQVAVYQSDKKSVRINGVKRSRVVELLGQMNAVFFGSIDLEIINGDPSERRHYLSVEISQISPRYVYDLGRYKRVLEQRNRLLRDLRERPRSLEESGLDAWNEQLVHYGAPLFEKRRFYIDRLAPLADAIHRELTDGKESLEIRYAPSIPLPKEVALPQAGATAVRESNAEERYLASAKEAAESGWEAAPVAVLPDAPESALHGAEAIAVAFREHLHRVASDELRRGVTLIGPQRDDMLFLVNGADARIFGSQGQRRTVALSLKLAEFRLIEDYVGEPPILLLDDVMSDLDDARRTHLLAWIRRRGQTFLTCTNLRAFPKDILAEATTFTVVAGTVTKDGARKTKSSSASRTGAPAETAESGGHAPTPTESCIADSPTAGSPPRETPQALD